MNIACRASLGLSVIIFPAFGIHLVLLGGMAADFERFGLGRIRRLTGWLQLRGAAGLLAGMVAPGLVTASASALTALMRFGIAARIRARDALSQSLPALVLAVLNLFVVACAWGVAGGV